MPLYGFTSPPHPTLFAFPDCFGNMHKEVSSVNLKIPSGRGGRYGHAALPRIVIADPPSCLLPPSHSASSCDAIPRQQRAVYCEKFMVNWAYWGRFLCCKCTLRIDVKRLHFPTPYIAVALLIFCSFFRAQHQETCPRPSALALTSESRFFRGHRVPINLITTSKRRG